MERAQFTFYESFAKAVQRIKKAADRAAAYDAIVNYALYEKLPDIDSLPDSVCIVFELVRPNLDTARKKATGGKARPKKDVRDEKDTDKTPTRYEEDTDNKKEKEKEGEIEEEGEREVENECYICDAPKKSTRFVKPSVEDVAAYCAERGNGIDAQAFVDYYEARNWMLGKVKMKDWKASVRTWERNGYSSGKCYTTAATYDPGPRESVDEIAARLKKAGLL